MTVTDNKLKKGVFAPLSLKEIQPQGWLKNQIEIQAKGLSGHLDKIWPDIRDSKWVGGDAEGWERVPYWLDGFIPMAWILEDENLKRRATHYMDHIINAQEEDGWICPTEEGERGKYDVWSLLLILKVMVLYYEMTEDQRIEGVVEKALKCLGNHMDTYPLFDWAKYRWFEGLIAIHWLYERTGEPWLMDLADKLEEQGFDWQDFFGEAWPYKVIQTEKDFNLGSEVAPNLTKEYPSLKSHVVNNAMMIKIGALKWKRSGLDADLQAAHQLLGILDEYHGMKNGLFSGDEHLAGRSPIQGVELCAVAELMYSLEHLIEISGEALWGDRIERVAYNALPATFSPDMWTHQYDQQINQIECSTQENPVFSTNPGDSNLFGLEPNFGCCTANLSQAWPKFALSTFMKSESGLANVILAPTKVKTEIKGVQVTIDLKTDYPFKGELMYNVEIEEGRCVDFDFSIRIPAWSAGPTVSVEGKVEKAEAGFTHIHRSWEKNTCIKVTLPMEIKAIPGENELYSVERGPLLYALPIEEKWIKKGEDFEIYATGLWNYGYHFNKDQAKYLKVEEKEVGDCPFSPDGAPLKIHTFGKTLDWDKERGAATKVPAMTWVADEPSHLKLIPYGCTNLRMTEMPLV